MTELSIVIASWNAKDYLKKCIESIITETRDYETEIIVVDNASSDGSRDLVRERFPGVKLICNETNLGFAKANNIGIKQSRGNFVCLVNSDVVLLKDCFKRLINYMKEHPGIGLLGPKILNSDGSLQRSCFGLPTIWNIWCRAFALDTLFPSIEIFGGRLMTFWPHDSIRKVEMLNGCFWMTRKEALATVGLLDERFFIYGEDIDWCKRYGIGGWDVVFFPDAEAIHYGGASSANAPIRFYLEMQKADLSYWKKHHNLLGQIGYQCIMGIHHMVRFAGELFKYLIMPSERNKTIFKIKRNIAYFQWRLGFYQIK
jgi:hypothetical protein